MKAVWYIMFAALAGLFLTACWPAEEVPLCGGVTDRTDHSAPKVISSKEITVFSASFWVLAEDASRSGRWNFQAIKGSSGRVAIKSEGTLQAQGETDAALLIALQEIIDRFELAKLNGRDRVTAGLPPSFSPTRLRVEYASGEHLYFQMNGDPEANWIREVTDLFLRVLPER
ncbi:MAG: hypothetical protein IKJ34_01095 [Mailhella sp.]|nr:hypothetical protein [Mailhella sp.]